MTDDELKAIEAAAMAPMSFDRPPIHCTHDEARGHAPWCHACDVADRASRPVPFEKRGRGDVLRLIAAVRERDASLAEMRAAVEFCGKSSDREVQLFGVWLRPSRRGDASSVESHRDAIAERDAEIARLRALLSPAAIVSRPACATCLRAWDVCVCAKGEP